MRRMPCWSSCSVACARLHGVCECRLWRRHLWQWRLQGWRPGEGWLVGWQRGLSGAGGGGGKVAGIRVPLGLQHLLHSLQGGGSLSLPILPSRCRFGREHSLRSWLRQIWRHAGYAGHAGSCCVGWRAVAGGERRVHAGGSEGATLPWLR